MGSRTDLRHRQRGRLDGLPDRCIAPVWSGNAKKELPQMQDIDCVVRFRSRSGPARRD